MSQRSAVPPYTIEPVTLPGQPDIPAPAGDEAALLSSLSALGIDVRVWA